MPQLTKKFYQRLADVLGATAGVVMPSVDYAEAVGKIADVLEETNPLFDAGRFEAACAAARVIAINAKAKSATAAS